MATLFTNTFLDDGTARTAGEAWTLNGGVLTIRTDTRWHANAPASMTGSIGSTATSATLGGGILIDGRNVREVQFNSGSGNVPAIGTSVTQGGVSGYLLGVYASLTSAPTAVGAAMPTTGFIKFREVTGGSFSAGALGGIGASATGADTTSWIEVVQRQTAANTVPRLGFFRTRGSWYYLPQVTSGAANDIIQTPTNGGGAGTHVPAVWIETGVGTNVYEQYPALFVEFNSTNLGTDARSKFVQSIGSGQVRIGFDGTNNAGFVPPAGCRIRIPNVIGRQSIAGSDATNQAPSATLSTRPDFSTSSAGVIDFEYFMNDWYYSFSSPNNIIIKNGSTFDALLTSNEAAPCVIDDFCVGAYNGTSITLTLSSNSLGGVISNSKFYRAIPASNGHCCTITACRSYTINNCQFGMIGYVRSTGRSMLMSQCYNITASNITQMNAYMIWSTCFDSRITNIDHCDAIKGNTTATTGIYVIQVTVSSNNILVDGVTFGLGGLITDYCNPYLSPFYAINSSNIIFRNAGTRSNPLRVASAALGPQYAAHDAGVNSNVKFQRIYLEQTRTSPIFTVNTSKDVTFESVHGTTGSIQTLAINALVKGIRAASYSATAGGSVYGTHYFDMFTADTTGNLWFAMNEPTASTSSYVTLTLAGSAGGFTSGGQVSMPTVGDELIIEMPYFALGHTGFANAAATLTGGNTGNFTREYQLDTGSGFGSYQTLNGANLSAEVVDPSVGFKMRLRITTITANTTNALTYVRVQTTSTLLAQTNNLYPLDYATISISALRAGSRVQLYDTTNSVELFNQVVSGTSFSYSAPYSGDYTVRVRAMYATSSTADLFVEFSDLVTSSGLSRSVSPQTDNIYVANGVDGTSVSGITINDSALLIEADDGTFSWAEIYAYETVWLFSEEGIRDEGRFIMAIDQANYLLDNFKIKNVSSPSAPLILIDGWGRDSVTGETIDIIDTTGGSIFSNPDLVIAFETSGGGGSLSAADVWNYSTRTLSSSGVSAIQSGIATESNATLNKDEIIGSISNPWSADLSTNKTSGTFGAHVQKLLTQTKFIGLKD